MEEPYKLKNEYVIISNEISAEIDLNKETI